MNAGVWFYFTHQGTSAHETMPFTFRMDLKSFWEHPHGHTQMSVFMVKQKSVKLTSLFHSSYLYEIKQLVYLKAYTWEAEAEGYCV